MSDTLTRPSPQIITEIPGEIFNSAPAQPDSLPKFDYNGPPEVYNDDETIPRWQLRQMLSQMPGEVEGGSPYEFSVGDNRFEFNGTQLLGNRQTYVFGSTDSKGIPRNFFVYRSNSEGGLRVSQAISEKRIVKGPEESPNLQYTQDTQLHPAVSTKLDQFINQIHNNQLAAKLAPTDFNRDKQQTEQLAKDFEAQIDYLGMGNEAVDKTIRELPPAGHIFEGDVDMAKISQQINQLGQQLEAAGLVPDFSKPASATHEQHPVLGQVTREVYDVLVNGRPVEWHMVYDNEGRVWIDRIRMGDSPATAYGTDKEMIYSGILTSKPIEYQQQLTGLPEAYRQDKVKGSKYTDITKLLNTFEPVMKFRAQRFADQANGVTVQ